MPPAPAEASRSLVTRLGRGPLARLLARTLVLALLAALLPADAHASLPAVSSNERRLPTLPSQPPDEVARALVCVVFLAPNLTESAFGELIAHTGSDPQPYAFTGEPLDPNSGFQYHRARWMDPGVGRFASVDPWEGVTFDPPTLHRYSYVAANPANTIDASGEQFSTIQMLGVAAIIGIVVSATVEPPRTIGQALWISVKGAASGVAVAGAYIGASYLAFRLMTLGAAGGGTAAAVHRSLEAAAKSGGPTFGVTTAQTTAPAVGRGLSVVQGVGAKARIDVLYFGLDRTIYQAQIPWKLYYELQRHHLVMELYLPTGAKEIRFMPEASRYIAHLFVPVL